MTKIAPAWPQTSIEIDGVKASEAEPAELAPDAAKHFIEQAKALGVKVYEVDPPAKVSEDEAPLAQIATPGLVTKLADPAGPDANVEAIQHDAEPQTPTPGTAPGEAPAAAPVGPSLS